ncbi:MAG: hypothetical protein LKJ29_09140 [Lactobacillus sp.]|uniref:Mga helix-turn-helix domain-containing protein n=2 Tax=Lacticaseibacillus suilingensis TaxID=2799577 RepID=A0ABW4BDP0_9LACO|nr:hypothetical protein [Lacticaseibacillus suilingensis]MCI1894939.1 hypothetical protein [Lactobacillus sp.]MCI1942204.1 hypothetical protein [Lactobacillus sp.]MCI2017218.1 hypothetical protein [Lactobacillus sp.]MCI2037254.1 hypothetical protein [Lactobacillus sp.]
MDEAALFNQEDATNFRVLQKLSAQPSLLMATERIQAEFGQTKYKLNKMFDTLNADLVEVSDDTPSYLDDLDKGHWRGHHLTKVVMQRLRLLYLQRSYLFTVFEYQYFFSNRYPKTAYMRDHYISNAKFYETAEHLKHLLKQEEFLPPHPAEDEEFATRLALFQLYFVAYNGVASPFAELEGTVAQITRLLESQFHHTLMPTQVTKLQFFLKIWLLRMLNGQHTGKALPGSQTIASHPDQLNGLHRILPASFGLDDHELDYLYAFLVTWHYLPAAEEKAALAGAQLPVADHLTKDFLQLIADYHLLDEPAHENAAIEAALQGLHVQITTFYLAPTTFIDDDQISFFRNLYPAFDHLILTFIARLRATPAPQLNHTMAVNLYFSYMFTLINYLPAAIVRDRVYVCVDFAQGQIYSDYIARTLRSFDNAFIVIESRLSRNTDVYLSDFHDDHLNIAQVTWANPPTSTDWQELAELTIQIKQAKMVAIPESVPDPFDLAGKESPDDSTEK